MRDGQAEYFPAWPWRVICFGTKVPAELDKVVVENIGPKGLDAKEFDRVKHIVLFHGVDESVISELLVDAHTAAYTPGTSLFVQSEAADRFFVILEGWVKLYRSTPGGHESVVNVIAPGESFAEAAIFDSGTYPVSATIVTDARLLVIPALRFLRVLRENPDVCFSILAALSRRLRYLVHQIEQISASSASVRLASFLLRLSPAGEGAITVHLPLDKTLIAGRLGMQPETLSRALSKLRAVGVVSRGSEVQIADKRALREWAHAQSN